MAAYFDISRLVFPLSFSLEEPVSFYEETSLSIICLANYHVSIHELALLCVDFLADNNIM